MSVHFEVLIVMLKLTVFYSFHAFFQTRPGLFSDGKELKTKFGSADFMTLVDAFFF